MLEYAQSLRAIEVEVTVLCVSAKGILITELKKRSIPYSLVDRTKHSSFYVLYYIWKSFKENRLDHVYSFDSLAHLLALLPALLTKTKLINGSIRDAGVEKGLDYFWTKFGLVFSNLVIANSFAGLKYYNVMRRGVVLYNAVNTERFIPSCRDKHRIVMVANFTSYKNHKCLVDAAIILLRAGYPIKVGFVGGGAMLQEMIEYVGKSHYQQAFNFHGFSDSIERIISKYGIGILSSTIEYSEGISNSILEYMGSGLVTIASNVGATSEIIQDESNGFMFSAEDSAALADRIKYVIDNWDKMESVRENALQSLNAKFDSRLNCERLISYL